MAAKQPARIGRYEVVDRLGRGGMGTVYLARDPKLGRTAAIKILTEDNEELRQRFAREARSAASLSHVNIVTIYDVGEDDGHPFIAMEYLDGETMAELIRRRAEVPLARRLQLILDLCAGLAYAHRRGIIHRDVKPSNLMITTEGTLKILDFGVARIVADMTDAGLTKYGALMGSPYYMSPEQAEGQPVDARSDIFSVGLVLYEILTSQRAFPGENSQVVLNSIVNKEPRSIRELLPDVDPELERIVVRGLQKSLAARYQTLGDLAADLERARVTLKDTAIPAGDATRPLSPERRTPIPKQPGTGPSGGSGSGSEPAVPATATSGRQIPNLEAIAQRRVAQIEGALRNASAHFQGGRYREVVDLCEEVLLIDPNEERALELLELAHRAINVREAQRYLEEAQAHVVEGSLTHAERLLARSLELQPDSPRAHAVQRDIEERRKERERQDAMRRSATLAVAKGRVNMEAGAFEAALRSGREALALDPESAEAQQLVEDAKAAVAERERQQEHDAGAQETVRLARQMAEAQDVDASIAMLRAFTPPHRAVTDLLTQLERLATATNAHLQREAEERRQIAAAEAARREAAQRAAQEAARLAAKQAALAAAEKRREAGRLQAERQAPAAEAVSTGQASSGTEQRGTLPGWEAGHPAESQPNAARPAVYRRPTVLIPLAAAMLTVAIAAWWTTREKEPPAPPVKPPVDMSPQTLTTAQDTYKQGNASAAIRTALQIQPEASAFSASLALLSQIRQDAAARAKKSKDAADRAGQNGDPAYKRGLSLFDRAELTTGRAATENAVDDYNAASVAFNSAAANGDSPELLMQKAAEAHAQRRDDDSVMYALKALGRMPSSRAASQFLKARKDDARTAAQLAEAAAAKAGAKRESPAFALGLKAKESADSQRADRDTQKAVSLYEDATKAFAEAGRLAIEASSARLKESNDIFNAATQAEAAGEYTRARAEIAKLKQQNSTDPRISELEGSITAAEQKKQRDTENQQAKDKAAQLLQAAQASTDNEQALKWLDEASTLDKDNAGVKSERERRLAMRPGPVAPPPPGPPPADSRTMEGKASPGPQSVADLFIDGFRRMDQNKVMTAFPGIPADLLARFREEWKTNKVIAWNTVCLSPSPPTPDGRRTINCKVWETLTSTQNRERKTPMFEIVFNLTPTQAGGWIIDQLFDYGGRFKRTPKVPAN